jgi:serine/threonine protein kinase
MGVVYEALHLRLQQRVAIKLLQPRVLRMPEVVARFEREARAACRLKSRNAVRILDVDHTTEGLAYMVMEFLEGHDLARELELRIRLRPAEAVDVVLQASVAMAEAHASGVIHRDLKPSNLLLALEGDRVTVKVLDFGISKITTDVDAHMTSTMATMGTPLYMSPEQIRSTKNVDARTDIWALGVILYEALVGVRPFNGTTTAAAAAIVTDPPAPIRPKVDVPEELERAVMRALAKRPEDRFPDVRAFAEALAPFASDQEPLRQIQADRVAHLRRSESPARATSTPSFARAATEEQVTPPPPVNRSAPTLTAPPGTPPPAFAASPLVASVVVGAPPATTTAGWSSHDARARRVPRRWPWVLLAAALVASVGVGLEWRARDAAAPRPPSVGSAPAATAAKPVEPPAREIAPATSAAPSAPTTSASAAAAASAPRPSHGTHAPKGGPSPRPSGSAVPAPAPAPTNPLHL